MPSLVMRLAGLGEKTMERLRERILDKHSSLENAFAEYVHGEKMEMSVAEFETMYRDLHGAHKSAHEEAKLKLHASQQEHGHGNTEIKDKAMRIFNSIDIDGGGSVSIGELHKALANFAPATTFSELRRRLLLRYGSFENCFAHLHSGGCKQTEDLVPQFIAEKFER
jgi:hypothetical protein